MPSGIMPDWKTVARKRKQKEQGSCQPLPPEDQDLGGLRQVCKWHAAQPHPLTPCGVVRICLNICELKTPKCVWPVGQGSRLWPPPVVVLKPRSVSPSASSHSSASPGGSKRRVWAVARGTAAAWPYFTFTPAELPSAFRMRIFRHPSALSKKFQFHVLAREEARRQALTTGHAATRPTPALSSKARVSSRGFGGRSWVLCFPREFSLLLSEAMFFF